MTEQVPADDLRVLLRPPTTKDATATARILNDQGIATYICADLEEIIHEARQGAGAALVAKEYLLRDTSQEMTKFLTDQAPWSDFPLLVLLRGERPTLAALESLREIGNMTLVPRPVRIANLVSTVQTALRDRRRQYAVRELLLQRELVAAKLAEDIRQRKETEQHLRESEEQFRQLADAIPQLAWTAQADGHIDWYNNRWYEYTGTDFESMQGWGWKSVHDPATLPDVMLRWKTSIATAEPFDMVFPLRGADGVFRPFLTRIMPFHDTSGKLVRWFGTNTDITEQRELQDRLRKVAADLSEADRRKDEFLAMLAHELRNPLSAMANALYLLDMPAVSDEDGEMARGIAKRQVTQLTRLIDDLLDISRITRGKVQLRMERFNLVEAVQQAVETTRPLIEKHQHLLNVEMPDAGELPIEGDPSRIEQVIVNLLTNAAKYTEDGGQITLSVGQEYDQHVITVSDTGIGIEADVLPMVFEMFTQAPRGLARSQGGLGIGLTLVKALVEMHSGQASVTSEFGKGSQFTVRLPAAQDAKTRSDSPTPITQLTATPRRVLVVDDNRETAAMLGKLLELSGHQVDFAYDGPEAIQSIRRTTPEVVLLDIGLPGLNGYEVTEQVRNNFDAPQPLIVAVSGYGQAEDRRRSEAAGFDAHLVKPVDPRQLTAILADADGRLS